MKPKIWNDITNILAKLASSKDYDPKVKYETSLEYYGNQIPVLPKPDVSDNGKSVVAKTNGTYELKKLNVSPAEIVTATGQMSAQQAADTLDNIGGEPEKMIVFVESGVANKTYAEIASALLENKTVVLKTDEASYEYAGQDRDNNLWFSVTTVDEDGVLSAKAFVITQNDTVSYYSGTYIQDPIIVTDTVSTSITLASAANNTEYHYGELTALTITAITNNGEFSITFTSGSTATVLTTPNSMIMPDNFTVEANTRYEINVKNSYAACMGWTVST